MISDIKIDFDMLKSILLDVIHQNETLITADESTILQSLYSDYEPKSDIDISNIIAYTKFFEKYYKDKIVSTASHCSEDKANFDRQKVNELEQNGKVFASDVFNAFSKHLYLSDQHISLSSK